MNKLYAFYCRAYQAVFRAALPILPYREPIQLDGLSSIVPLLAEKRIASVLLVTDASVRSLGLTSGLEAALKAAGVACAVYDKTVPNPTIANIEEGRALYLTAHAQAIIAVGGGSVMDCAKVIGARVVKPRQSVQRMRGLLRVLKRTPLLIAVPTTAGTGSETTLAAVITDPAARHKYPINDFALIPDYAVLDPELTRGLPPMLTATTGMDALTHAIEAYIGRSTNRLTRAMSEEAATRIVRSLYKAYTDGGDMQARAGMLRAAYCAGVSFTRLLRRLCPRRGPFARRSIRRAARAGQCGHPAVFSRRIRRGLPQKAGQACAYRGRRVSKRFRLGSRRSLHPLDSQNKRQNGHSRNHSADPHRRYSGNGASCRQGEQPALPRSRADG